jgi:hypothetical protein
MGELQQATLALEAMAKLPGFEDEVARLKEKVSKLKEDLRPQRSPAQHVVQLERQMHKKRAVVEGAEEAVRIATESLAKLQEAAGAARKELQELAVSYKEATEQAAKAAVDSAQQGGVLVPQALRSNPAYAERLGQAEAIVAQCMQEAAVLDDDDGLTAHVPGARVGSSWRSPGTADTYMSMEISEDQLGEFMQSLVGTDGQPSKDAYRAAFARMAPRPTPHRRPNPYAGGASSKPPGAGGEDAAAAAAAEAEAADPANGPATVAAAAAAAKDPTMGGLGAGRDRSRSPPASAVAAADGKAASGAANQAAATAGPDGKGK